MPTYAECYDKAGERVIILNTRAWLIQPFEAPDWLDLRVGFFLSLTDDAADDTITGLSETITEPPAGMPPEDRYWIGLKDSGSPLPEQGVVFIGFTNRSTTTTGRDIGDSRLSSSDIGTGTTNTNFWRPNNSASPIWSAQVSILGGILAESRDGVQQHFPQNAAGAGGYAVFHALRLLRNTVASNTVTVQIRSVVRSCDMLFSNTPTEDLVLSTLNTWTPDFQTLGPVALNQVPDALYYYWPFNLSRLRIHAQGVRKFR